MKKKLTNRWIYLFILIVMPSTVFCTLNSYKKQPSVYPIEFAGVEKSKIYELAINGVPVFVGSESCYGDRIFEIAQCNISKDASVTIRKSDIIENYRIRPLSKEIHGELINGELHFKVSKPQMLYVEVDQETPLLLFLTPFGKDIPEETDKDVVYFGPGIHEAGVIQPQSGQTIYLAPGARVKGRIYAENANDVKVLGRGVLDARGYTNKPDKICGIEFKNCDNIKVEGIGLRTGEWWQTLFLLCNNIEVDWMNLLSFGLNNDGIDIDGVTNFYVHDCFIGCGDDGFGWHAVDGEANGEPPTQDCLAENCVIYNTHAGNGLRVGASMETQLFRNITFRNIDVLEHANYGIRSDYSDWALSENISFENFHIEKPKNAINVKIEKTRYSNDTGYRDERGNINGLNFINLQTAGGHIVLNGYDEDHAIRNVIFKNCRVQGRPLTIYDMEVNDHVYNLNIKK